VNPPLQRREFAGRYDDRYFILVFPSRSSGPHYYVFSVQVIRVDIECIPGDHDTRKLPEFTANVSTTIRSLPMV